MRRLRHIVTRRRLARANRTPLDQLRLSIVSGLILLTLVVVAVGVWEDHRSCGRQIPVREAVKRSLANQANTAAKIARRELGALTAIRLTYAHDQRQVAAVLKLPDCSGVLAGT